MNLPIQSQPVNRQSTATSSANKGIAPSDCCPDGTACGGVCFFGQCLGYCYPV